jgi:hypothetical protein
MECSALLNGFLYSKMDSNLATKMSARMKIVGVSAQEWEFKFWFHQILQPSE